MRRRTMRWLPALGVALAMAGLAAGLDRGAALGLGRETLRALGVAYFALLACAPLLLLSHKDVHAPPPEMQGRSVLPLLSVPTQRALRSERWKYVAYTDRPPELFDLREDPHETRNLAPQAGDELLLELRRQLDAFAADPRAAR